MVTNAVEDYLKAIYKLQCGGSPATTNAVAEKLGVRAASVTAMLQHLADRGLAAYTPYRGAYLTDEGIEAALSVVRRHRLIELYLHRYLDVPWDRVHEEAERLEHAISPYLEERIDASLGRPSFDPHGDPIPASTGAMPVLNLVSLSDLPPDSPAEVRQVPDDDPERLRYLASLGLVPGALVTLLNREPFDGPISLSITSHAEDAQSAQKPLVIGPELARHVFVTRPD